jgi:hypothetical protein
MPAAIDRFPQPVEPAAKTKFLEISWFVDHAQAGCPRHKGPSSFVVRASRPHCADSGFVVMSRSQMSLLQKLCFPMVRGLGAGETPALQRAEIRCRAGVSPA